MSETNGSQIIAGLSHAKILAALVKAQSEMHAAPKDKINPHFGSKYADFASIVEAIRGTFAKHGLGFHQDVSSDADGVVCSTTIFHESGEMLTGAPLRLPVQQKTPQAFGSAITYARRYSLQAIAGVAADVDDDGNEASVQRPISTQAKPATNGHKQTLEAAVATMAPKPSTNGAPEPERSKATQVKFGRTKGQYLCDIPEKDLAYHLAAAKKAVDAKDPKWAEVNLKWANAVSDEVARRGLAEETFEAMS